MTHHPKPVTFGWIGDLHLTDRKQPNVASARLVIDELNRVVRPDVVQFAGDNAQHGSPSQFRLFNALRRSVNAAQVHALVGDHDVEIGPGRFDTASSQYRRSVGAPTGTYGVGGFRFIRLNTMDLRPDATGEKHGMSDGQLDWFAAQAKAAVDAGETPIVCQHHFPFKVFEQFDVPGMARWRQIIEQYNPAVVFCGHTHYGQVVNDGRRVYVTTRSMGDPEGGPAAYTIAHLSKDELALRTRSVGEAGPILLITSPRERILSTRHADIVTTSLRIKVRCWTSRPLIGPVQARVNDDRWIDLRRTAAGEWQSVLSRKLPPKGLNRLAVRATDSDGRGGSHEIEFVVDPTGRFTAVPMAWPVVERTDFS